MSSMNKRTKRICAASASAAVIVAGGVTFGAGFASATGSLALTTGNSVNAINLGQKISASVQTLSASTGFAASDDFALTYGTSTTAALAKTATAAQIQTALNGLASVTAAGGVTVSRTAGTDMTSTTTRFQITFNVPGVRTAITTTDTDGSGGASTGVSAINSSTGGNTLGGAATTAALASATFGTKVTTTLTGNLTLSLDSFTAPSGVTLTGTPGLQYKQQASGSATVATSGWAALANAGTTGSVSGTLNGAQDTFLAASQPGTYSFHFTDDAGTVGTGDDLVSPTVTMTVLDNFTATSSTADDWSPAVSVSAASVDKGAALTGTVPLSAVSLVDTRNSSSGVGILGSKLSALVGLKFTSTGSLGTDLSGGTTDYTAPAAITAGATSGTRVLPVGVTANTGTITATAMFDTNGDGTITDTALGTTAAALVASNGVTNVDLAPTTTASTIGNTGTAVLTGGAVAVATNASAAVGATTLTVGTASATNLNGHRIKISKTGDHTEYATVLSGGNTTTLTLAGPLVYAHASGSTFTDMSAVAVKNGTTAVTYTATVVDGDTDKSGNTVFFTLGGTDVASLTTTGTTVSATGHIYSATTNASGVASLTVTDGASTPAAYTVTASSNSVSGGTLTSTYGASAATTLTITSTSAQLSPVVGTTSVTITGKLTDQFGATFQPSSSGNLQVAVSGAASGNAILADGMFSYVYTPASAPAAGASQTLNFAYTGGGNPSTSATVNWASSTAVGAVNISSPTSATTPSLATYGSIGSATTITGTVTDGTTGLAYKTVTLTGDPGVYFSTSSTGSTLVNSLDVASNGSGTFTAYAFYTKAGSAKITATSGGKSANVTTVVNAASSSEFYKVELNPVAGLPGSTLVVSGKITDVFGNPVNNAAVALTPDTISLGVLGTPANTNANGEFSTTFIAGSSAGVVNLTAKINGGTNRTPDDTWSTIAGLTLPTGVSTATSKITIGADTVALDGPASRVGAGKVHLTGTARPNGSVDIYVKSVGSPLALVDSVTADSDGEFATDVVISQNTTFIAKTSTATSSAVSVHVVSTVKLMTKVGRKGTLAVTVSGGPSKRGTVTLWQKIGSKTYKLGSARVTGGAKTWVLKPGKGSKTYKATYQSSGSDVSAIVSKTVKL